mmetsp:Transcript_25910/g.45683  ORF Transcript_25910/g.45683 Transcript_25910/m.45683 type:complete len:164 (+) Transcript_25910:1-492(+)
MLAAHSPSNLEAVRAVQAEAVAALAALACSADPAGITALLAALRDVAKILVELCVNSRAIDTAYPAARLVSKLVCVGCAADAEAQNMACELTKAVRGAESNINNIDSLVRGELAEAVKAVARQTTTLAPMSTGLDATEIRQALHTLTRQDPGQFVDLQDGVMA